MRVRVPSSSPIKKKQKMPHILETEADTLLKEIAFLAEKVQNAKDGKEIQAALDHFNYLHDIMQTIVNNWPVQELGAESICQRQDTYKQRAEVFNRAVFDRYGWEYPNECASWRIKLNKLFVYSIFVVSAATLAIIVAKSFL